MPLLIAQAALDYLIGASFAFVAYGMCGHGTGKMIELFGTENVQDSLPGVYNGWGSR
jgi:hypothetical protein